jgi:ubiquinone biosynthesis protein COQ4
MSSPNDTRLHPLVALKAIRALLRDRDDTRQVFLLMDALRGKTTLRQFARFQATEVGQAVLAERRSLLARLSDRAALAQMPDGSLGRAYLDFVASENLSAEGLVAVSNLRETLAPGEDLTLFRERTREMHDLLHVVAGYGRDPLGEACLAAFTFAQSGLKGFAIIAISAAQRIASAVPAHGVRRAVFEGYRRGRHARWLIGADWENLLCEPLEAVRAGYRIAPPVRYPRTLAAIHAAEAAAGTPPVGAATA